MAVTSWEVVPWVEEFRPGFEARPEFPPYLKDGEVYEGSPSRMVRGRLDEARFDHASVGDDQHSRAKQHPCRRPDPAERPGTHHERWRGPEREGHFGSVNMALAHWPETSVADVQCRPVRKPSHTGPFGTASETAGAQDTAS